MFVSFSVAELLGSFRSHHGIEPILDGAEDLETIARKRPAFAKNGRRLEVFGYPKSVYMFMCFLFESTKENKNTELSGMRVSSRICVWQNTVSIVLISWGAVQRTSIYTNTVIPCINIYTC